MALSIEKSAMIGSVLALLWIWRLYVFDAPT
jgi:hypothetical protein